MSYLAAAGAEVSEVNFSRLIPVFRGYMDWGYIIISYNTTNPNLHINVGFDYVLNTGWIYGKHGIGGKTQAEAGTGDREQPYRNWEHPFAMH